jgi:hypothetical protein
MKRLTIIAITWFVLAPVCKLFATLTLSVDVSTVSIPFLTMDYNLSTGAAQVIKTSAETLTIKSTSGTWTLSVRALTSTFSFIPNLGDPNPNKPAADLSVRAPATSAIWLPLTTSDQVLSTGPKSNGNQTRTLDYRLNSNLSSDPPGTYTISLIYTLTSP